MAETDSPMEPSPVDHRRFATELALLFAVGLVVTITTRFIFYPSLGISLQTPQPARTVLMLGLLTWLIHRGGQTWKDFGLNSFRPFWLLPILVLAFLATQIFLIQPLGDGLRSLLDVPPADRSFLSHIQGNALALAGWLVLAWTVAAFGEELIFRGYLLNRIGHVLGNGPFAWTAAVFVQASLFGLLHIYLGYGAAITIGFKALFTGTFFLISKRNLWPLILIHGLWDTLGFTLVYLSGSPST